MTPTNLGGVVAVRSAQIEHQSGVSRNRRSPRHFASGNAGQRTHAPMVEVAILGRHFGGKIASSSPEFGRVELTVDRPEHPLFQGLPGQMRVWASHNDQVAEVPPGWLGLAHSAACRIEAMAHPQRPIWGVQFHPEVEHTEGGLQVFRNFLALARK